MFDGTLALLTGLVALVCALTATMTVDAKQHQAIPDPLEIRVHIREKQTVKIRKENKHFSSLLAACRRIIESENGLASRWEGFTIAAMGELLRDRIKGPAVEIVYESRQEVRTNRSGSMRTPSTKSIVFLNATTLAPTEGMMFYIEQIVGAARTNSMYVPYTSTSKRAELVEAVGSLLKAEASK